MAKTDKKRAATTDPADPPYREAILGLIGERWEAVWAAMPVAIEGTDPEGVHDVRVASRRLRAAMDVAGDAFPKPWFRRLHRAAKEITSALGEVRDRDVLLEHLMRERERARVAERPGLDLLIARIDAERSEARREMLAFLSALGARGIEAESRRRFLSQDATVAEPSSSAGPDGAGNDPSDGTPSGGTDAGDPSLDGAGGDDLASNIDGTGSSGRSAGVPVRADKAEKKATTKSAAVSGRAKAPGGVAEVTAPDEAAPAGSPNGSGRPSRARKASR